MTWVVYSVLLYHLIVLAIIDQPIMLIILPVATAGSYALLALITWFLGVSSQQRTPPHRISIPVGARHDQKRGLWADNDPVPHWEWRQSEAKN